MSPKTFISYSWTTPEHEAWVLRFAEDLRSEGVDIILDKWDLRDGHDAHVFMEQIVTDDDVKKVIMVCDRKYTEKSNQRAGGAGTEAQIISSSLYNKAKQDKFLAVIREYDDDGKACVPVYYGNRLYIDLVDEAKYPSEFDRLLRWIYDQPLYVKPDLGKPPAFLSAEPAVKLATAAPFRRAIDAIRAGRDQSEAVATEYLATVVREMAQFSRKGSGNEFDVKVVESIEQFLPNKNELIEFFTTVAMYRSTAEMASVIHRFFESLIHFHYSKLQESYTSWSFDNFKFISNELFLSFVATMIARERFNMAAQVIQTDYYVGNLLHQRSEPMSSFCEFNVHVESLEAYNKRMNLRKINLQGFMIEERCKGAGIDFRHIMAADLVLYLAGENRNRLWYPFTLVSATYHSFSFELFARSASLAYFDKIKGMMSVKDINEFRTLINKIMTAGDRIRRFDYNQIDPGRLVHADTIGTRP